MQYTFTNYRTTEGSDPRAQMHTYGCLALFFTYMHGSVLLPHISILREFLFKYVYIAQHCIHVLICIFRNTFFLSTVSDIRINWRHSSGWPRNIQNIISCQIYSNKMKTSVFCFVHTFIWRNYYWLNWEYVGYREGVIRVVSSLLPSHDAVTKEAMWYEHNSYWEKLQFLL